MISYCFQFALYVSGYSSLAIFLVHGFFMEIFDFVFDRAEKFVYNRT